MNATTTATQSDEQRAPAQGHPDGTNTRHRAAQQASAHVQHQEGPPRMTITRHTPILPTDEARLLLQRKIDRRELDLRAARTPGWLGAWLDTNLWHDSTTAERRELAAEAIERRHQARLERTANLNSTTAALATRAAQQPAYLPGPCSTARPGTAYVACATGCGRLIRWPRPAVAYCDQCQRPARKRKAPAFDFSADIDPTLYV